MMEENEDSQNGEAGNQDEKAVKQAARHRIGVPWHVPYEPEAKRQKLDESDQTTIKSSTKDDDKRVITINDEIATTTSEKEPIQMSIWEWEAVLAFLTRMEMADRVSLVCHALKKLCWPRLHGRKVKSHVVKFLHTSYKLNWNEGGRTKALLWKVDTPDSPTSHHIIPFATVPPPDYIQGFQRIQIDYLDAEVLRFIRLIRPLLATNLHVCVGRHVISAAYNLRHFLQALAGCPISSLDIDYSSFSIREWRRHFPGLLEHIPVVHVRPLSRGDFIGMREMILAKVQSGKQFVLNIEYYYWQAPAHFIPIDNICKAFQSATQPHQCSFMIRMWNGPTLEGIRLENEQTGEVFAVEQVDVSTCALYRCPSGEVRQWREEAEKLLMAENCTNHIGYNV